MDWIGNLCDPASLGKADIVYRLELGLEALRAAGSEPGLESCVNDAIIEIRLLRDLIKILREK
jgi:hypothetical protein